MTVDSEKTLCFVFLSYYCTVTLQQNTRDASPVVLDNDDTFINSVMFALGPARVVGNIATE